MSSDPSQPVDGAGGPEPATAISTAALIRQLQTDRLWLLRQIDSGAWPEWRLDLAALERELGELLDRVGPDQASAG